MRPTIYLVNSKDYEEPSFSRSFATGVGDSYITTTCDADAAAYQYSSTSGDVQLFLNGKKVQIDQSTFFIRSWRKKQTTTALLSLFLTKSGVSHFDEVSLGKQDILNTKIAQPLQLANSLCRFPDTWIGNSLSLADIWSEIEKTLTTEVVVKTGGGMGKNVHLCKTMTEARELIENNPKDARGRYELYQIQSVIKADYDLRVIVLKDTIIKTIRRQGEGFLNNISQGGTASVDTISDEERDISILAAKKCGLDVAGVDLIRGEGGVYILEVNRAPGIESISKQIRIDLAKEIGSSFRDQIERPDR